MQWMDGTDFKTWAAHLGFCNASSRIFPVLWEHETHKHTRVALRFLTCPQKRIWQDSVHTQTSRANLQVVINDTPDIKEIIWSSCVIHLPLAASWVIDRSLINQLWPVRKLSVSWFKSQWSCIYIELWQNSVWYDVFHSDAVTGLCSPDFESSFAEALCGSTCCLQVSYMAKNTHRNRLSSKTTVPGVAVASRP